MNKKKEQRKKINKGVEKRESERERGVNRETRGDERQKIGYG